MTKLFPIIDIFENVSDLWIQLFPFSFFIIIPHYKRKTNHFLKIFSAKIKRTGIWIHIIQILNSKLIIKKVIVRRKIQFSDTTKVLSNAV